jgi:hypothetical protein
MSRLHPLLFVAAAVLAFSSGGAGVVSAQTVLSSSEAAKSLSIKDLNATPSAVSGVVANNSPHAIRNIEILVQYHWLWGNEFKPGRQPPGESTIIKLDKELQPGQSAAFRHVPAPPLPERKDGRFTLEVTVAGFTVVVPAT